MRRKRQCVSLAAVRGVIWIAIKLLLFGVVRAIEIVGEAAAKLSESARTAAPDIPWTAIVSMRNRLVHGYFDIDPDIVWVTAMVELPLLLPKLRVMRDKVD